LGLEQVVQGKQHHPKVCVGVHEVYFFEVELKIREIVTIRVTNRY
jgi:hypothetical protein